MTPEDAPLTVDWMVRQYGFDRAEVEQWVRHLHFNWPLSVKAVEDSVQCSVSSVQCATQDGGSQLHTAHCTLNTKMNTKTIGLLNISDYRIEEETAQIAIERPDLLAELNAQRYTAVFSFIVAPEYRGSRLNYDMLMSIMPELKAHYDFLFIPVLHRLKTHHYWQRWGAREFYRDADCVYYKLDLRAVFSVQ